MIITRRNTLRIVICLLMNKLLKSICKRELALVTPKPI